MNLSSEITLRFKSLLLIIGASIAVCVGVLLISSANKEEAYKKYADQVNQYKTDVVQPTLAKMDTLKRISDSALARANVAEENSKKISERIFGLKGQAIILQSTAKQISERNKFLEDSIGKVSGPVDELIAGKNKEIQIKDSIIVTKDSIITENDKRHSSDAVTIVNLRVGITAQTERADKAELTIRSWPTPPQPKSFLGITIPLPTRKQSFLIGTAVGIATYVVVRAELTARGM